MLSVGWGVDICNQVGIYKLLHLLGKKQWGDPNCTNPAICFYGFNMGNEFPLVCVVIDPVPLVVGEEPLVGGNGCHHALGF